MTKHTSGKKKGRTMSDSSSNHTTLKAVASRWTLAGGAALGLLLGAAASVQAHAANESTAGAAPFVLTLVCPPDAEVACGGDLPPATTIEEFIAQGGQISSDCPDGARLEWLLDTDVEGDCPSAFTRFYSATDGCGGFQSCSQRITINDTVPPEIRCPDGGELPCGANELCVDVSDNCTADLDVNVFISGGTDLGNVELVDHGNGCFTLTFNGSATVDIMATAEDACGNRAECRTSFTSTCEVFEGCTHGFWKNHTGLWNEAGDPIATAAGFTTGTLFNSFFGLTPAQSGFSDSKTMLGAMQTGGGGGYKLARHGLAALLNLASGVNMQLPPGVDNASELEDAMANAYVTGVFEPLADQLKAGVETLPSGCPGKD